MKRRCMACLTLVMILSCLLVCQAAAASVSTVVVVDVGGPIDFFAADTLLYSAADILDEIRPAVKRLLRAMGAKEQAALITYGETAQVVCGFTTDRATLERALDALTAETEHRNIAAALDAANELLSQQSGECRVILFTPGLTDAGAYQLDGAYDALTVGSAWYRTDNQVPLYAYANQALTAAEKVKQKAALYTVGLFGTMEGLSADDRDVLSLFELTVSDLASSPAMCFSLKDLANLIGNDSESGTEKLYGSRNAVSVPDILSFSLSALHPESTPEPVTVPTHAPTAAPERMIVLTPEPTPAPVSFSFQSIFGIPVGDNGESWPVYAAPSSTAWRGANGKASCWTTSDMMFAGWDGDWLLIAYRIGDGSESSPWRIGYVSKSYVGSRISRSYDVGSLFQRVPATVPAGTELSDDPTFRSSIMTFTEDTGVTFLAIAHLNGTSAYYIETAVRGQLFRGFVKTLTW